MADGSKTDAMRAQATMDPARGRHDERNTPNQRSSPGSSVGGLHDGGTGRADQPCTSGRADRHERGEQTGGSPVARPESERIPLDGGQSVSCCRGWRCGRVGAAEDRAIRSTDESAGQSDRG
jgi:hypothetical protein